MLRSLVGSEMCIRDRYQRRVREHCVMDSDRAGARESGVAVPDALRGVDGVAVRRVCMDQLIVASEGEGGKLVVEVAPSESSVPLEYPETSEDGKVCYVLVRQTGELPGTSYLVARGAAIVAALRERGDHEMDVAVLSAPPLTMTLPAGSPDSLVDGVAFETWGPTHVRSRRHARQLCQAGSIKLNGERVFGRAYVVSGDQLSLAASVAVKESEHCSVCAVPAAHSGVRLDRAVQLLCQPHLPSRSMAKDACKRGEVRVNGKLASGQTRVHDGDNITLRYDLAAAEARAVGSRKPPEVVYEDEWMAAVWKPAGLDTNGIPLPGETNLESQLRFCLSKSPQDDALAFPMTVHRLDRATAGVVLAAKTCSARKSLMTMFAERRVHKRYLSLIHI
eukprot:TRINITY_DN27010_c0_g1_i1.p1 TRINITY_DN27010_c0_g1~~TRINITY_DN27010_c0_g1_i1.p1  ORF type:complete len:392 (-),score=75.23 TRINITY_DN27010_c0_g1_i1:148-1323(-)